MARDNKYQVYLKEYNKLAKKADRRMRELERFSRYPEYESILNYAYRTAAKDIQKWTPPGDQSKAPRWQRAAPADTNTLKAKIKDIEKFLRKPTSTMTGVKKIYMKRTDTINRKYGTNFTWQSLANYFESGVAEKGGSQYGSKTFLKAIGTIQKQPAEVLDKIKKGEEAHIQVKNAAVRNAIESMLADNGLNITDLL